MRTKIFGVVLGVTCLYGILASPAAQAADSITLSTVTKSEILWVEAASTSDLNALQIRILAPGKARGRTLWQTCRFATSTPGTYRCGIDVSEGSLAEKREGTWAAVVTSDGSRLATTSFTL